MAYTPVNDVPSLEAALKDGLVALLGLDPVANTLIVQPSTQAAPTGTYSVIYAVPKGP